MNRTHITSHQRIFPAEWEPQDAILLAWPHKNSDWAPLLEDVQKCYCGIIDAITQSQDVILIVDPDDESFTLSLFKNPKRIYPVPISTNDTWARDFSPLMVSEKGKYIALDFQFNGWGLKFPANKDNLITQNLFKHNIFAPEVIRHNHLNFVLEGGSVESNGAGIILTTSQCLLSPNRNDASSKKEIETILKQKLGADSLLWLDHGYLAGDDTDSHIDTLARFCDTETIVYVQADDPDDEHYEALTRMEKQLSQFKTLQGRPYKLIPLPMADPIFDGNQRLPATYANFLITNQTVLMPFYGSDKDLIAQKILQGVFPSRKVIGIDCRPLIQQHGSLHCVTMQLHQGVVNKKILNSDIEK
ncbi:agmatine deiminase family protein [Thermophagus xiamenensis]|uniref:Agmatine deiminase n=1 Tax=Thermophagus xiamenensis TaxID=385682 RepID=A0A1I2BVK1_9BACT|nr:agmatine deiminase family protein [Thermophagus xiamenensis]SFE60101.1 agmatine deiminase [Thermophagus xiamenensis]